MRIHCRPTSSDTQDDKDGADAVRQKRVGQTRMSTDVDRVRKVLHYGGIAGELLEPVF